MSNTRFVFSEDFQLPYEMVEGIRVYSYNNGKVSLGFTAEPMFRIVRFGFVEKDSILLDNIILERKGEKTFNRVAGHRFWTVDGHDQGEKYSCQLPGTLTATRQGKTVRIILKGEVSQKNYLSQVVEVTVQDGASWVDVNHILLNHSQEPVQRSIYTITQVNKDGLCFTQLLHKKHEDTIKVLKSNVVDQRYQFVGDFLVIRQVDEPKKRLWMGVHAHSGLVGFAYQRQLFVKTFAYDKNAEYPFEGSTVMFYSCDEFMEMENASPLVTISPGGKLEFRERWLLLDDIKVSEDATSLKYAVKAIHECLKENYE